ncbi:MAG: hypothetical protein JOZ11_06775 [Alphaproteobacteria bacterium]|nr:hypothetical protein [Alphaproteobacteria bacterium]
MVCLGISLTKRHASVDVRTAFGQLTSQPIRRPGGVVRFEQDLGIVELASDLLKAYRKLACPLELTSVEVEIPQDAQRARKIG